MRRLRSFTLVEIMIVVAIIGLLAAIAIPNFIKARELAATNACKANLKQIQGAIQVWAIDTNKGSDADVSSTATLSDYISKWPTCLGKTYELPLAVSSTPVCPNKTDDAYTDHAI